MNANKGTSTQQTRNYAALEPRECHREFRLVVSWRRGRVPSKSKAWGRVSQTKRRRCFVCLPSNFPSPLGGVSLGGARRYTIFDKFGRWVPADRRPRAYFSKTPEEDQTQRSFVICLSCSAPRLIRGVVYLGRPRHGLLRNACALVLPCISGISILGPFSGRLVP